METNSKAVRVLFYVLPPSDAHPNPEIALQPPEGRSNNRIHHGHRETGLIVVAVCRHSHTSPIDKRRNWSCAENY